jgi:hypothetical protein
LDKKSHPFIAAALVLVAALSMSGTSALAGPRFAASATNIPCGQRQTAHLDYQPWSPPNVLTHRLTFQASGGGTVYFYVVPNIPTRIDIPNDTVTRTYTRDVANPTDAPNPVGRQVIGMADLQPCSRDLVITNVSVTVVSSAQD